MSKIVKTWTAITMMILGAGMAQSQTIGGAVFGGGRMADVNGNTVVKVYDCDTVSAVYGGNDIAGTVNGANGSTITIGHVDHTTAQISIGSVYGGGNGYYAYNGTSFQAASDSYNSQTVSPSASIKAMTQTHQVGEIAWTNSDVANKVLSFPSIAKTSVEVNTEYPRIDSLFGGAKNAFISLENNTNTNIAINGGVMYSVFGGNNFGGFLGDGSTQNISVTNTLVDNLTSANLGGNNQYGHAWTSDNSEHGIRYLFGGGNKVAGKNVTISVTGGQIDTLFAGGNSADVTSTSVSVNVTTPLYDYEHSPYYTTPVAYNPVTSVFDIRCLFGGNNAADMAGIPTLTLTKGGIHNVYGGGNKGVMNGEVTYASKSTTDNEGSGTATLSTFVVLNSPNIICDTIYGGGQSAGTAHDTYVCVTEGKVGTIFGGTNISGDIPNDAKSNVRIDGANAIVYQTIFGGSNGYYRCMGNSTYNDVTPKYSLNSSENTHTELAGVAIPSIFHTNVLVSNGTVLEHIYGGGNLVTVAKPDYASGNGSTKVKITGGTIGDNATNSASIFGGGNFACVYGTADMIITGGTIYGDVYGGNDKTGTVTGRGRTGNSTAKADGVTLDTIAPIPVLDGGHTTIALNQANAASYVLVQGSPTISGSVYGGGNGAYNYEYFDDESGWIVESNDRYTETVSRCQRPVAIPTQYSGFVDINMNKTGTIGNVYAGGNSATVGVDVVNYGDGSTALTASGTQGTDGSTLGAGRAFVYMNCVGDDPTEDASNINVGNLFGGNNVVDMTKVPRMVLVKGKAGYVYGGGNLGGMTGNEYIKNLSLSTYVPIASPKMAVAHHVYAGCNAADLEQDSYVSVTKGYIGGKIFGGNDASGEVPSSHVLIGGDADLTIHGDVYGGGNGDYPFYRYNDPNDPSHINQYKDLASNWHAKPGYVTQNYYIRDKVTQKMYQDLKGRPYVDSASVIIRDNVTLEGSIYGGGISGDCRKTDVLLDAEGGNLGGMVFGAGQGRINNQGIKVGGGCHDSYIAVAKLDATGNHIDGYVDNATAMGNVLDSAVLTVRKFQSLTGARHVMFGGGRSGNVGTTVVRYEATAQAPLKALYLGCLASDVQVAATGLINAYEPTNGSWIIDTIYGGNDFTGRVNSTDLIINSGTFTHVYGSGNGDYDYRAWLTSRIGTEGSEGYLWENAALIANNTGSAEHPVWALKADNELTCADIIPYSMDVDVTINGGHFLNTVYGGGNMGLVGNRDMNPANVLTEDYGDITLNVHGGNFHRHIFSGARGKADMGTWRYFGAKYWTNDAVTDPSQAVGKNVDGKELGKQLVYGFKVFNMDGGHVEMSVYGGSESVDDGYPFECKSVEYTAARWYNNDQRRSFANNSTLRPSSVINIVGGTIEKSVYGGGYQGNIYGSVYINIGSHAVYESPVWSRTYGTAPNTFTMAAYKPNITGVTPGNQVIASNETLTTSMEHPVNLRTSVYNGSDWGEALDNPYFNTRGVYGGETNILIDGKGYNISQTNTEMNMLPSMNIRYSVIGSGTSTEGGDVTRAITIRHYGDWDCPRPSRRLSSIQRADKLILDSVFITLEGEQDAYMAYASPSYSLNRLDTVIMLTDNILLLQAPAKYIGELSSLKKLPDGHGVIEYGKNVQMIYADNNLLYQNTGGDVNVVADELLDNLHNGLAAGADCPGPDPEDPGDCQDFGFCDKMSSARGQLDQTGAFNSIVMANGSYFQLSRFIDLDDAVSGSLVGDGVEDEVVYGGVHGWSYLVNEDKTMAYVYGRRKAGIGANDGGFVAPCLCDNNGTYPNEIDYVDVSDVTPSYRTWRVGSQLGSRTRHITLVANAVPDDRLNYNLDGTYYVIEAPNDHPANSAPSHTFAPGDDFGYATAKLELPPSNGGNFYVINQVVIDQENGGDLHLVDEGFVKDNYGGPSYVFQAGDGNRHSSFADIASNPNRYFSLAFTSNSGSGAPANFNNVDAFNNSSCWTSGISGQINANERVINSSSTCWPYSLVVGNRWYTETEGYISPTVKPGIGIIPSLTFTLTYNKNITNTITRDILFRMQEFDSQGHYVGPVDVIITISTVIRDFGNMEAPVMAMYNEGITNQYIRKVTIPAGFLQRDIWIEGIDWELNDRDLDDDHDNGINDNDWFHMQGVETPIDNNNHFSIEVCPSESNSDNVTNHLGWYHIQAENIDVYNTALEDLRNTTGNGSQTFLGPTEGANGYKRDQSIFYNNRDYLSDGSEEGHTSDVTVISQPGRGKLIGTLDGRAPAAVDIKLNFNGDWVYQNRYNNRLATVTLHLGWANTKTTGSGTFDLKIYVLTRMHGDTIYWAPDATLTRNGYTVQSHREKHGIPDNVALSPEDPNEINQLVYNNPDEFLRTFADISSMYREGDVIDILETVPVEAGGAYQNLSGDDYSIMQIIRYSGSHFKFPGEDCANTHALFDVKGNLSLRNVWINGSYCTRVKESSTTPPPDITQGEFTVWTHDVNNGVYYYNNARRIETLHESTAPVIYIHQEGSVNLSTNVHIINNFNNGKLGMEMIDTDSDGNPDTYTGNHTYDDRITVADAPNPNFVIPGGAIALVAEPGMKKPELILGHKTLIADNLMVDWNAVDGATYPNYPMNYGAGIYVDGGIVTLGAATSNKTATDIEILHNYYLKSNGLGAAGVKPRKKYELGGSTTIFDVYILDTVNYAESYALNNVYLSRTAGECPNNVRRDNKSDIMRLATELTPTTRIGISKWFPGYKYNVVDHQLENYIPRDTIAVVFQSYGTTDLVKMATENNVFFNDSTYFNIDNRSPQIPVNITVNAEQVPNPEYPPADPSFLIDSYDKVNYTHNTTANPGYGDQVTVFFHEYVHPNMVYLHRCATFGKGVTQIPTTACNGVVFNDFKEGDSIAYHWNSLATCVASTDSVFFHVGGGFFPYTYTWLQDIVEEEGNSGTPAVLSTDHQLRARQTFGGNNISNMNDGGSSDYYTKLRNRAQVDTLVLTALHHPQSVQKSTYLYRVQATDISGCSVEQPFMVRVAKVTDVTYHEDVDNFLLHDNNPNFSSLHYRIGDGVNASGVDSSSFHDHVNYNASTDQFFDAEGNVVADYTSDDVQRWVNRTDLDGITRMGIRRAGFTNNPGYNYASDDFDTEENRRNAWKYQGKPYNDTRVASNSGLSTTVYADPMVPRYLRVYQSYKVTATMLPSDARPVSPANGINSYLANDVAVGHELNLTEADFCPGAILHLVPAPKPGYEYMAWNFDPSSDSVTNFVVRDNNAENNIEVYYAPSEYWYRHVTSKPAGYVREYNGDVTITSREGLAWLISTVNGLNNQNAHSFHNNVITIDFSGCNAYDSVDMQKYKWTPLGNLNNPFRGTIKVADGTTPIIRNIIVNEKTIPRVGFFGYADSAKVEGFRLQDLAIKGNDKVGGLAAETHATLMKDISFTAGALFGENIIGGVVATGYNSTIENFSTVGNALKMKGSAISAGGFFGTDEGSNIYNGNMDLNATNLTAIYIGSLAGQVDDPTTGPNGKKNRRAKTGERANYNNNYVHIITDNNSHRVGGMIGMANALNMNNNYVYGVTKGNEYVGGLVGNLGQNVNINNCYYVDGMAGQMTGYTLNGGAIQKSTTFRGYGNQVGLTERINGYTNLTRVLNAWVKNNIDGIHYNTWRSDLEGENSGYPIFGDPDMISIYDSINVASCYEYEFEGLTFDQSGRYIFHVVDSSDYLDSTFTLVLTINHGDSTSVSDSVVLGQGYEGFGLQLSDEDIRAGIAGQGQRDIYTFIYVDSLYNANGCDSIVFLTLYVVNKNNETPQVSSQLTDVKVYPNPTRGKVTVEGSDLQSVEVYDNVSRRVLLQRVDGDSMNFDLSNHPAGSYYVRVKTAHGTVVKKVIKK